MRIKGLLVARSGLLRADETDENDEGTLGTLEVRFSPFGTWYEINSWWEGRFLEQTKPGAFKRTARNARRSDGRYSTKVMFNHGMDFNIGDKLLGVPTRFEETEEDGYHGPIIEAPLEDTSYNRDLAPLLRAGAYGSSFMFEVIREKWDNEPEASDHNPEGLPERTIEEVRVFEAGPVTWPASPTATSGLRSLSMTDHVADELARRSGGGRDDLLRSYEAFRSLHRIPDYRPGTSAPSDDSEARHVEEDIKERDISLRRARLATLRR